jgi:hypothetical protein
MDFEFSTGLYYNYSLYKERIIASKRVKHSDITPLIRGLNKDIFTVIESGKSYTGKEIFLVSAGKGRKKIFMWSQMHGDESTGTMAIFDIFNFLSGNDGYNLIRDKFFDKATLYFMPMVNPDGAEQWTRRNYLNIDINRDAARTQSPEGKILKNAFNDIKADFGFNLHDQNPRYSAGNSFKTAAVSFLAPPYNQDRSVNLTRSNAIKLISGLAKVLDIYIPGHIAKYSDDYESRAFGDTFQALGTSTILIESGGWNDDPDKQFLRKLNFILLLSGINSIINSGYIKESHTNYDNLPFNEELLYDLILRNLHFHGRNNDYLLDIGINYNENFNEYSGKREITSTVEDTGDLSIFHGNNEFDLEGYDVEPNDYLPGIGKSPNLFIKKQGKVKYELSNGVLFNPALL